MTVQKLKDALELLLRDGEVKPETQVCFRHSIHKHGTIYSDVDYVLTAQKPGALVLCYDDGSF